MQAFEKINAEIRDRFVEYKRKNPERMKARLKLSWSNWGFGIEELDVSAERLARHGVSYIELHGNHYGPDLGYVADDAKKILTAHGLTVSGICGMFSATNDLSSNTAMYRQNAIDYLKREVPFAAEMGATYMLVVPAAVGRSAAYDTFEIDRSAQTLRSVAHLFVEHGIVAAVEPIRSAEVSIVHTFDEALAYIEMVDHPGVRCINGDIYHMQLEEKHIAGRILDSGERLVNLHLADTNRNALGEGAMDVDTLMMALYLIDYNNRDCFCTAEPLGPGGDPYPAMYGKPDRGVVDELVRKTVETWNEREEAVRSLG